MFASSELQGSVKKMGRRTKEEAEETRRQILMSALDTFCEKGYSQSSLTDIAQRLGLTKGAVYWHFKNKLDLFETLAKEMDQRGDQQISKQVDSLDSVEDVRLVLVSYTQLFVDDAVLRKYFTMVTFRTEWSGELSPIRLFLRKKQDEFVDLLAQGLSTAGKRRELRSDVDPKIAAKALVAMVDGLITNAIAFEDEDLPRQVAEAVDVFLRGLRN